MVAGQRPGGGRNYDGASGRARGNDGGHVRVRWKTNYDSTSGFDFKGG